MPVILGLDPSQKTGWAFYDTSVNLSAIKSGVLKISAVKGEFEGNAGQLGKALAKLIKEHGKPDFAVIEQAPRRPYGGDKQDDKNTVKFMGDEMPAQEGDEQGGSGPGLQGTLSTNQMAAALCAILGAYGIPFETMTDSKWRKHSYGFGKRAGWTRPDWKRHARAQCAQVRITATNDDMAEACWIAFAGKSCEKFRWMENQAAAGSQEFRMMKSGRAA
ncbi:hypothetical protein C5748_18270 [Phyllobacterium phragmitis]|uniref:Uncharacterized protein n=1 Tax=Phyllobacterium phragmitis TaxID=2670329 RepID=A0A2S9INK3_9HYPH|nr:hypothetical protein [Phyllobacterium phragmitis]PRD42101.1 hypothetical protein C5748_18270 [Phyllobacterium phragmitis]